MKEALRSTLTPSSPCGNQLQEPAFHWWYYHGINTKYLWVNILVIFWRRHLLSDELLGFVAGSQTHAAHSLQSTGVCQAQQVSDQTDPQARPKEGNMRSLNHSQESTGCRCGQYLCSGSPVWTTWTGSVGSSGKSVSSAPNSLTLNPNFLILSAPPRDTCTTSIKDKPFHPTSTPNSTPKF